MSEYNFITNPLTGRKVNIHGKVGQQVLTNYKKLIQTGYLTTKQHFHTINSQKQTD